MSKDYRIHKSFPKDITKTQFYVDMIFYVPETKNVSLIDISSKVAGQLKDTGALIYQGSQKVKDFIGEENIIRLSNFTDKQLEDYKKNYPSTDESGNTTKVGEVENAVKSTVKNCKDLKTYLNIVPDKVDLNKDGRVTVEERQVDHRQMLDRITFMLPEDIPADVIDVSYEARDLGMLGALADFTKDGGANVDDLATSIAIKNAGKLASVISNKLEKFTQDAIDISAHDSGVKQNIDSDMVLLQGIERRTTSLKWKLVVRNREDVKSIMDIIDFLRIVTLPKKRDGILEYPASVLVKFILGGREFFRYDEAFITNLTTNFSPEGFNYSYDGNPMFYDLDITIMEQSRKYRDDYVKMINKRRNLEGRKTNLDAYGTFEDSKNVTDNTSTISSSNKSEEAKDIADTNINKSKINSQ